MDRIPIQWNRLWDAFRNIAIVFSFFFNLMTLCVIIVLLDLLVWQSPQIHQQVIRPKFQEVQRDLDDLLSAPINLTVSISETIPVEFTLPVHTRTTVTTLGPVPVSTSANFVLPGGGGSIRGSVSLVLPPGMRLPVELYIEVPVSQTISIQMEVPVSVELKDTELGAVIQRITENLKPFISLLIR
ncbi:MAG: hypothetical protein RMK30_07465 [Anaerolineae bacterium]|nr:hypothetical protein [Anaerolineae bacterium]MDW8102696.1 hypothetical protein [Anaerolineae bacterium]